MPFILTLAQQKGGVGKTTLSLNLYTCFEHNKLKCAIVDADYQGSITNLYKTMQDNPDWQGFNLIQRESINDSYSKDNYDYNSITAYISRYSRKQLLYFLSLAFESAENGYSS